MTTRVLNRSIQDAEPLNVGEIERRGLAVLRTYLDRAVGAINRENRDFANDVRDIQSDDNIEIEKAKEIAISHIDISEIIGEIENGLDRLVTHLSLIERITEETDLTQAVRRFKEDLGSLQGIWSERVDGLEKAKSFLEKAKSLVPEALTGPGALANLQKSFDLIASAWNILSTDMVTAPKIPNALEPEDPRQLGFCFNTTFQKKGRQQQR